jgi:hypothetical protein
MAGKRHPSMAGIRDRLTHALGWPAAQLRGLAEQVEGRLEASRAAAKAKYEKARAENAGKVIEVSPPSSRGTGTGDGGRGT